MDKERRKYSILLPPIVSICIIIGIYFIKKIYPFGCKTVAQADLSSYAIVIKYMLDAIRAKEFGNFIFTDLIWGGTNIITIISNINPFFVFYFLCNNSKNIMFFMSFVIVIKTALCSITSYICFNKIFGRECSKLNIVFSLLYAFSSYVLINHTTLFWIEVVILFPILILGLKNIYEKQSFLLYSITLAICTGISYQLVYMILLSIIITTSLAFFVYDEIKDKKKIATSLGIGTFFGLLLSSVITVPIICNFFQSSRNNIEISNGFLSSTIFSTKLSYLLFSSILIFTFIKSFKYIKKDKTIKFLIFSIISLSIIPIFFEGVNIIFHGGIYDQFPFRYGFIPLFFMNILAIYYFKNNYNTLNSKKTKLLEIFYFVYVIAIILAIIISVITEVSNPTFVTWEVTVIFLFIYNLLMYIIWDIIECKYDNKKRFEDVLLVLTIIEIFIFSFGFIGIDEESRGRAHSDVTIVEALEIMEDLEGHLDYDSGYRYKDLDNILIENASLFTKLPSTASWIYSNADQMESYTKLGYSQLYMRVNSSNGTFFSDNLLGLKYILTKSDLEPNLYRYISETKNGIKLYENKDYLPLGIVYDRENDIKKIPNEMNYEEYQNWIYKKLFNKNEDLLYEIKPVIKTKENNNLKKGHNDELNYVEYEVEIEKDSILYVYNSERINNEYVVIEVNDEIINVSAFNSLENKVYPVPFNNGILNLGYFKDEKIKIKIYFEDEKVLDLLRFVMLDYSKYREIVENKVDTIYKCKENTITITTNAENNQNIFIPITYDKNWNATINGKEVEVEAALGGMISLKLEEGTNEIELVYKNDLIKIGGIISIISLFLLIIIDKFKNKILNINILCTISYYLFMTVSVIVIIFVYFLGIISTFL